MMKKSDYVEEHIHIHECITVCKKKNERLDGLHRYRLVTVKSEWETRSFTRFSSEGSLLPAGQFRITCTVYMRINVLCVQYLTIQLKCVMDLCRHIYM